MNLIEDVRFGLRSMAKNPGFTAVAIAALALGIGVNAVVFGIVDAVLFKGIPFVGDNVLYLTTHNAARPNADDNGVSYPDFRGDAIGKRVRIYKDKKFTPWLSVVGVAPNILQNAVTAHEFDPLLYVPYRQMPSDDMALMARTTVDPLTLASAIRREVQALDEDMPVYNLRTLEERLAVNYWDQKIFGTLFGTFAIIALLLASIGLYAVIAHSVSQRTQEIGVRMALGASGASIVGLVLRQGLVQLGIGLAIGLAGAFATTRLLASELQGVKPTDPSTFALISLVLSAAAILGCLIPARRAMAVDPVIALRNE
jgi:putative ABC transport system permease protein